MFRPPNIHLTRDMSGLPGTDPMDLSRTDPSSLASPLQSRTVRKNFKMSGPYKEKWNSTILKDKKTL